jgi:membrane-bound metal-dependent hydrolase YbcI (DUF457 family)
MPLPLSHGLLGASLIAAVHPHPARRYFLPLLLGAFLANSADFDFLLAFALGSRVWHRGFSHSLIFAAIVCLIFVLLLGSNHIREAISYGLAFASHALLDYATKEKGGGVELLWPFSSARLGLGWIGLSELPSKLSALEITKALVVESLIFAPLLALIVWLRKYAMGRGSTDSAI